MLFIGLQSPSSSAQITHELKTNLFALGALDPDLHWEINASKRWSFELGLRYTFTTATVSDYNLLQRFPYLQFRRQLFSISPAVRFYFSKVHKNYGLFTGLSTAIVWNTYLDSIYPQAYQEANLRPAIPQHPINSSFIGVLAGYKWPPLLREHLILEMTIAFGASPTWWLDDFITYKVFTAEYQLKVVYRFSE